MEKEESCSSTKDQAGETCELKTGSEKLGISSAVDWEGEVSVPGVGEPGGQTGESHEAEVQPTGGPERDEMVEMEDIRDCKVTQRK